MIQQNMAKILVRFKRVAAAFDEARESSGSDHSAAAESLTDLSDLVNSFLERDSKVEGDFDEVDQGNNIESNRFESERNCSGYNSKDVLKNLVVCHDDDEVKRKIHAAVENALLEVGNFSSPDFRRSLMARLRHRGFDAGLCKSKWEKTGKCPSGKYEYIDVLVAGTRYIIEISLAKEFEIARPTGCYEALLDIFPPIFVGRPDEVKQIVKLMCNSIKKSMKSKEMFVPPWRRLGYVQAKWLSTYKRTINEVPAKKESSSEENLRRKRSLGFVPVTAVSNYIYLCKEDFAAKVGRRVGNLAAALNDSATML